MRRPKKDVSFFRMRQKHNIKLGDLVKTTQFGVNEDDSPRALPMWHDDSPGSSAFYWVPIGSVGIVVGRNGSVTRIKVVDTVGWVYTEHLEPY